MKITVLSGSARKGNNTLRVAKAIKKIYLETTIIDYQEYDIPSFSDQYIVLYKKQVFRKS